MFSSIMCLLFSVFIYICTIKSCTSELLLNAPSLYLYSPGELEFTDVLVKRVGDNLTLACELRGDTATVYVWNYVPQDNVVAERPYTVEKNGSSGSRLLKPDLSLADSGRYVCSAPPFSVAKYILVQDYNGMSCAHGAFACGARCVLPAYVCDGRHDCSEGDDEAPDLCGPMPCARADRLNCSSGRCIPEAACCRSPHALCRQPACCLDQPRYNMHGAFVDAELPPVFDDRRAPDDYGFIQSTIYTVTACALIFMIAVVLLVSAICKMHMKRAALRSYAHAHDQGRAHYTMHYAQQRHRFPPCYEASGLLEHATHSPLPSPTHDTQCGISAGSVSPSASERRTRLAALTSVFTSRYRQVPTQCTEVEMTAVTSTATRSPSRTVEYCSPTGGAPSEGAPQLNVANEPTQTNRLTLQLGRFQLSIPRFGRPETRPDTPNVAEINIDDLEFVRLNSRETYTLNGRTIHLLGGNFENYPPLTHGSHPPPYNEAMRYKLYGPPPEYLSRDRLNRCNSVDEEARSNIEMPPCYDDLANGRGNGSGSNASGSHENGNGSTDFASAFGGNPIVINRDLIMSNIIENVSSPGNNNNSHFNNGEEACGGVIVPMDNNNENYTNISIIGVASTSFNNNENISQDNDSVISNLTNLITRSNDNITTNNVTVNGARNDTFASLTSLKDENENVETLNSVIDNLPAIDSDLNANDGIEVNC